MTMRYVKIAGHNTVEAVGLENSEAQLTDKTDKPQQQTRSVCVREALRQRLDCAKQLAFAPRGRFYQTEIAKRPVSPQTEQVAHSKNFIQTQ